MPILARFIYSLLIACMFCAHNRKPEITFTALWVTQMDFKSCFIKCHQDNVCVSFKYTTKTSQCIGYPKSCTSRGCQRGNFFNFCTHYVCTKAKGYTWLPRSKMCIRLDVNPQTWQDSREACQAEHGDLAVFDSKLKTKSIKHFIFTRDPKVWIKANIGVRIWIGMRRVHKTSVYKWINGETGYTAWASKDPDYGDEECVMVFKGSVADARCCLPRYFLCQLE